MKYQARWGPKGFICSANKILPLMDLSATKSVKSESQSDTSDTEKTNLKGFEPYSLKLSTICLLAAGVNPRGQIDEWEAQVGKAYPLYIEGVRFGPKKLYLKSVSSSIDMFTNTGKPLSVKFDLDFEEYTEEVTTQPTESGGGGSSGSSYSTEKKTALTTTASYQEKNAKSSFTARTVTDR